MGRFRRLSRGARLVVAIAVGGAVFGVVTAVQAAIPDSNGVIHGCYLKVSGPLRVVDGSACKSSELALNWNQTGQAGPTGPTGAAGPADITPPLGGFTPTQLVQGAILTCTSASTGAVGTTCFGPKLNGLDIGVGGNAEVRICATVTGNSPGGAGGSGAAGNPHFIWTGTTWALSSVAALTLVDLSCFI